jgi:hypothetical protein
MTNERSNYIKRFLNIFTLMHFEYFADAEKELTAVLDTADTGDESTHAKPIAKLITHWVTDLQKEKNA